MKIETYLFAPLATVTGIIISITLWYLNRQRKALCYEILSCDTLVNLKGSAKNRLEIKFNQRLVHDAKLLVIKIINTGHLPIVASDFQTRLTISVPEGAQIVFADIMETAPADLEDRLRVQSGQPSLIEDIDQTNIHLRPILLNSGDSATIQMLVNNLIGSVAVRAHLQGIKAVTPVKKRTWIHTLMVQIGALIMAGSMLMVEPHDVMTFGPQELLPTILIFLLGYIVLFAGLYAPKRLQRKMQFQASQKPTALAGSNTGK